MGQSVMQRYGLPICVSMVYLFLYIPIVTLVVFSCNESSFPFVWQGFSLKWYSQLWASSEIWFALKNSLFIASCSVLLSLVLGVLLVFYGSRTLVTRALLLFYGTLAVSEIVIAVFLLTFFVLASIPLGYATLIAAHTMLGLGYVVPMVQTQFSELDYRLTEAALDLGATRTHILRTIILPLLSPTLFSAAVIVFVVSWDDFIIAFFCAGATAQTLPLYIFSLVRSGTTPVVNALSTLLLALSSLLVMLFLRGQVKKGGGNS